MIKKLFLAGFIFALAGCTDKLTINALNGTFTGEFFYVPPGTPLSDKVSAPASVSFSDKNYSSQGNSGHVPAGGSGTFEIEKDGILNFRDKNIWTANFDWGLILTGKYNYRVKGDSLILTRFTEPCPNCSMLPSLYQYRLKRSN